MSSDKIFKTCPKCGHIWQTRLDFNNDDDVVIIGYQPDFEELRAGLFLFNHTCNSTLSIEVGNFQDLYHGPVFTESATGSDECPGFCLHQSDLDPCPAQCECAFAREIIQLLKQHHT